MSERGSVRIDRLADAAALRAVVGELADVLVDCVDGGGSVGFLPPLDHERAVAFWLEQAPGVDDATAPLFVARLDGRIAGTVQLKLAQFENQSHRADVAKLLVHSSARRRGIAESLMAAAEAHARAEDRWLLVLDTLDGSDAERLYRRLGWSAAGSIPDYALVPGGSAATTIFWKRL
jgi:GNAT superfamily N-acetyltransferase